LPLSSGLVMGHPQNKPMSAYEYLPTFSFLSK
jgi:hypothetical protein